MTEAEFDGILNDNGKRIEGDIDWREDEDHSPSVEFRVPVISDAQYPLVAVGSVNPLIGAISYGLIHQAEGRIYGLDLGKEHHNPSCQYVGEKHKHRWTDALGIKHAYVPDDITAAAEDVALAWQQFCTEARIRHNGVIQPPPRQTESAHD